VKPVGIIGIISDTHGSVSAWEKAVALWKEPQFIIHCGDVLYHGPKNPLPHDYDTSSLPQKINASPVPVLIARGNCDSEADQQMIKWPMMAPYLNIWWERKHIIVSHGTHFSRLRELIIPFSPDLVVTGHTHVASIVREGEVYFLNPGSASLPKGRDPASVALLTRSEIIIQTLDGLVLHRQGW